jgi:phosphoribosylglycinamide formyltransferase
MVHNVIREVDQGQPIKVVEVEAREGDTLEKFEERIHANEHQLIVDATNIVVREILAKQAGY